MGNIATKSVRKHVPNSLGILKFVVLYLSLGFILNILCIDLCNIERLCHINNRNIGSCWKY